VEISPRSNKNAPQSSGNIAAGNKNAPQSPQKRGALRFFASFFGFSRLFPSSRLLFCSVRFDFQSFSSLFFFFLLFDPSFLAVLLSSPAVRQQSP
jgi:hypothetical protein